MGQNRGTRSAAKVNPDRERVDHPRFNLMHASQEHWSWQPVGNAIRLQLRHGLAYHRDRPIHPGQDRSGGAAAGRPPPTNGLGCAASISTRSDCHQRRQQITSFLQIIRRMRIVASSTELLQSPQFGEKWARHWMDLVRYADTYGHEFDYPKSAEHTSTAITVIRALNADVPL